MPKIFISYARSDRDNAARLAEALKASGHDVWWDKELKPARDYDEQIVKRVNEAQVVVVLWSPDAVKSDWVKYEAQLAYSQKKLAPASFNAVIPQPPPPMSFMHVAGLHDWSDDRRSVSFIELESAILKIVQERWVELLSDAGGERLKKTLNSGLLREVVGVGFNLFGIPAGRMLGFPVLCGAALAGVDMIVSAAVRDSEMTPLEVFLAGFLFIGLARILAQFVEKPGRVRELLFFDKMFTFWLLVFCGLAASNLTLMLLLGGDAASVMRDSVLIASVGPAIFFFGRCLGTAYTHLLRRV